MQSPREAQIERVLAEMAAERFSFQREIDAKVEAVREGHRAQETPVSGPDGQLPHLPLKQVTSIVVEPNDSVELSDGIYWSPQRRTITERRQQQRSHWR